MWKTRSPNKSYVFLHTTVNKTILMTANIDTLSPMANKKPVEDQGRET